MAQFSMDKWLTFKLTNTTVSPAAKTGISALKTIPGINIGASVLNAIVAGGFCGSDRQGIDLCVCKDIYWRKKRRRY